MNRRALWLGSCLCGLTAFQSAQAGMQVEVSDPRYFEHHHDVIFPSAEIKLVSFEFEAAGGDETGKQRAKELHDQYLARIQGLPGAAVITYGTPPGQRIQNYRVEAEKVAREQHAQMALWGRILVDRSGRSLINARLSLIEPPPGITARYSRTVSEGPAVPPIRIDGLIDDHVSGRRIDFRTVENDVSSLAYFLSGLARYYKGAAAPNPQAAKWLKDSVAEFEEYARRVPETVDATALADAHIYVARACVRLADAEPASRETRLRQAEENAGLAARLDPNDSAVPTVQAVVAARKKAPPEVLRAHLTRAVTLAPGDSNARVNLAVLEGAEGRVDEALRLLDGAAFVHQTDAHQGLPDADALREQLMKVKSLKK